MVATEGSSNSPSVKSEITPETYPPAFLTVKYISMVSPASASPSPSAPARVSTIVNETNRISGVRFNVTNNSL